MRKILLIIISFIFVFNSNTPVKKNNKSASLQLHETFKPVSGYIPPDINDPAIVNSYPDLVTQIVYAYNTQKCLVIPVLNLIQPHLVGNGKKMECFTNSRIHLL
jgi:hypothetical protein